MSQQKPYESADPRMNRIALPMNSEEVHEEEALGQWQTYEVFQQKNRGDQHIHVGSLHAPNPEMALVLAKEQYGRREQCANLWIVKSLDVLATSYEDADMFQHAFDKTYRESEGYKVKDTIEQFVKDLDVRLAGNSEADPTDAAREEVAEKAHWKAINLPDLGQGKRKVLIRR